MKKNIVLFLAVVFVVAVCITTTFGLTGCSKNNPTSEPTQSSTQNPEHSDNTDKSDSATDSTDEASENIGSLLFNTLSVNKDKVYGKVSNGTDTFSFINEIKTEGLTKYIVSLDIYGNQKVATKTIPLNEGDNTVYVIEMLDDEPQAIYEVTIRRRLIYKVSFYTNNGTRIFDQQVEEDSCATMPKSPERRGYTFDKWNYDFSTPITKDTIINAKWNIITYNISYNLNGGTIDGKNPTTYTVEDEITLIKPTKRGYNANWDNGGKISKGSIGDKTFNANWTAIVYKISYNLNGGTINGENPTTYTVEDEITLTNTPTKRGYNFANWDNGGKISKGSIEDKTFNANWEAVVYKISYNLNGGAIDGENPTTYTIEDEITLINPTKRGYDFANWDNDGKIAKGSIGDKTFSATYTPIVYKITYKCGKGVNNTLNPLEYTIESETIILNDAYYINADFVEWQQNSVKISEITKGSIGDVTLTAVWDEYDVKLQENGDCYTVIGLNTNKTDIEIKPSYKGKKVTSITDNAFKNCSQITSITIPDSVTSIGSSAFSGCSALESMTLPFVGNKAGLTSEDTYQYPFGYIFGTDSYDGGIATSQYYYSDSTSSKTDSTYYIPSSLKNVTITGNNILYGAFYNCSSLTSVTLGNSVASIGDFAFFNCNHLTSIAIGSSVASIGDFAFKLCKLTDITIPNNVTSIGDTAFACCESLTSVTIGNSVESIGNYAFGSCESLSSVTIGNSVKSIGNSAFGSCESLSSITIPDSVTSIGDSAFNGCKSLSSITIPDSITSIGDSVFRSCSGLTSITIPNSVTSIGDRAFIGCDKLVEVINKSSLNISKGSYDYGQIAYYALNVKTDGESDIMDEDNYLFYTYDNINYLLGYSGADKELTLPTNYNGKPYEIYAFAFYECNRLVNVTIPDSVTSIGDYAFEYCSELAVVTIGNGVTSIGDLVFSDCSGLTSITIPNSVTSIGDSAFSFCSGLTSVTIGNGVTSIGNWAFNYCDKLKTVFYTGTVEQWNKISISSKNNYNLSDATRYYYSENEPALNSDGTAYDGNYWHYDSDGITPVIWKKEN